MEENNQYNDLNRKPLNDDFFKNGQRVELAPKVKLVFVTGILFVVFGGLALLQSGFSLMNSDAGLASLSMVLSPEGVEQMRRILPIANAFALIMAVIEVAAGIVGIIYCRKPEKAFFVIAFGFLIIGLVIINSFIVGKMTTGIMNAYMNSEYAAMGSVAMGAAKITSIIGLVLSLIIPVLYVIGGFRLNKRKAVTETF